MRDIHATWDAIRQNHRGPYRFLVTRPSRGKNPNRGEWLAGDVESVDVAEECEALLTDPRDSITSISIWSDKEEQFVGSLLA